MTNATQSTGCRNTVSERSASSWDCAMPPLGRGPRTHCSRTRSEAENHRRMKLQCTRRRHGTTESFDFAPEPTDVGVPSDSATLFAKPRTVVHHAFQESVVTQPGAGKRMPARDHDQRRYYGAARISWQLPRPDCARRFFRVRRAAPHPRESLSLEPVRRCSHWLRKLTSRSVPAKQVAPTAG